MFKYKIRLFGILKSKCGLNILEMEAPAGLMVREFRAYIAKHFSDLGKNMPIEMNDSALADSEWILGEESLVSQSELSLIPPVCGG